MFSRSSALYSDIQKEATAMDKETLEESLRRLNLENNSNKN